MTADIVRIGDRPELLPRAAAWFHGRWGIPEPDYQTSMEDSLRAPGGVPRWYVMLDGQGEILAGAGVIENDFHRRRDLRPNLCALFVVPPARGRGLARALLDFIRADMGAAGAARLYLLTDHTDFYERCGWTFFGMAEELEGGLSRVYTASCPP